MEYDGEGLNLYIVSRNPFEIRLEECLDAPVNLEYSAGKEYKGDESYVFSDFKFNNRGYITHFELEGGLDGDSETRKYSYDVNYAYNADGQMTRWTLAYNYDRNRNYGVSPGAKSEECTETAIFSWANQTLANLETSGTYSETEDGDTELGTFKTTFTITAGSDQNTYKQNICEYAMLDAAVGIHGDLHDYVFAELGWYGLGSANYITK